MNNKKTIITLILVLLIGIIGLTVAYFSNTTSINNLFSTNPYGTTVEEVFTSPSNWLPGTTTDKEITVTNSGSVDEAVRISYSEIWKAKDNTILSGLINQDGNLTSTEENSEHAAIINFSNNDDWTYSNGYYYYNYRLAPNDTTSSLIDSVTFNSKVKNSSNCITTENNGVKSITCNSTNNGYDGATYTLTFKIETVQYNKYTDAWNTDVSIAENKTTIYCNSYKVGDIVSLWDDSEYYVLMDSPMLSDYVVALKKESLTASQINSFSTDYVSQNGEYPYYRSDTCNEDDQSGCTVDYDSSDIKKIIDEFYKNNQQLKEIDGYKARLINEEELYENMVAYQTPSGISYSLPEWFDYDSYWTMYIADSNNSVNTIIYGNMMSNEVYSSNKWGASLRVRPVVNIKKYCTTNKPYRVCDKITYNNENYYVVENSNVLYDYVTIMRETPFTYDELVTYNEGYEIGRDKVDSNIGTISYYKSDTCYYNSQYDYNTSGCKTNYNDSFVKKIIDNWSESFEADDLVIARGFSSNGFIDSKARIMTDYELSHLGYSNWNTYDESGRIQVSRNWNNDCPDTDAEYWFYDWNPHIVTKNDYYKINALSDKYAVRPVINLKKCAITNTCE